jgi:hypothetical protein
MTGTASLSGQPTRVQRARVGRLIAVLLALTGCSAVPESGAEHPRTAGGGTVTWETPTPGPHTTYIATARAERLRVLESPTGDLLTELIGEGGPIVLALTEPPGSTNHVEVLVPGRPNGRTGWVHRDDVELTWTNLRIRVELAARTLTLYDGSAVVTRGRVAIGSETNPTPVGRTYVSESLVNPDPGGLYGPYALGLALWSDTLTEYAGGDGQIGIHGTDRPDLLGEGVSHGCVRVHNDLIRELAGRVPLGTPVDIVA